MRGPRTRARRRQGSRCAARRHGAEVLAPRYRQEAVQRAIELKPMLQELVADERSLRDHRHSHYCANRTGVPAFDFDVWVWLGKVAEGLGEV